LNEGESIHRPAPNEDDRGVTSETTFSDKFDHRRVKRRTFSSSAFTAAAAALFVRIHKTNEFNGSVANTGSISDKWESIHVISQCTNRFRGFSCAVPHPPIATQRAPEYTGASQPMKWNLRRLNYFSIN